jgi:hypothetical protein
LRNKLFLFFLLLSIIFFSCGKKETKKEYIARVNDTYLLKEDLSNGADTDLAVKSDYIRNWINTEVLYQEGMANGIGKEDEFNNLYEKTKRELIKTLWIKKYLEAQKFNYTQKDLEDFYNKNKETFRIYSELFYINQATFRNEDKAITFRNILVGSNWSNASRIFLKDPSVIDIKSNELLYAYKIFYGSLYRMLQELDKNETSIILKISENQYTVIQMLDKFNKDDIPPFNIIMKDVEKRYLEAKKKDFLDKHIKDLYSKYEIEIK